MAEIAPKLYKAVPKRVVRSRTVAQALNNRVWASDIKGALTVPVLMDYFRIWDLLDRVVLQQEVQDHFRWKLTQTGTQRGCSVGWLSPQPGFLDAPRSCLVASVLMQGEPFS